jgi:branched-chain amino acid aminotransferase
VNQNALLINLNGQFLSADAPAVSALDRGFLYGDGLFETLRTYGGAPFLLDEHLARLNASAAELRISDGLDTRLIAHNLGELLRLNGLDAADAYVRITLTRGVHLGRLELDPTPRPTVSIAARPLRPLPPAFYEQGIPAIIASIRQNADSPLPRHKTLNYLGNLLAKTEARDRDAHEAILLNTRGEVAEAASSNVFLVRGSRLLTPPLTSNILPGITRAEVLRLAGAAGIPTGEQPVLPDELHAADEVFLTNSIAELLPVRSIDGRAVGPGEPGPLTRTLHAAYCRRVGDSRESAPHPRARGPA